MPTPVLSHSTPEAPKSTSPAATTYNLFSLSTKSLNTSVVHITATGEIDASNADELADYVLRHAVNHPRLIVDLAHLEFFGVKGFRALLKIHERCSCASVSWTLVPGRAVSRVLGFCDPQCTFPIAV
jgi:anti-anti-sigma factor